MQITWIMKIYVWHNSELLIIIKEEVEASEQSKSMKIWGKSPTQATLRKKSSCLLLLPCWYVMAIQAIKHIVYIVKLSITLQESKFNSKENITKNTTVAVSRSKVQFLLQMARTYKCTANIELCSIYLGINGYVSSQD